MLAEAVDSSLSAADQAAFDLHLADCAACREMLAEATRGAAWMGMLRGHAPEPPPAMLERIFAQTSGAPAQAEALAGSGSERRQTGSGVPETGAALAGLAAEGPAATGTGKLLPFRRRALAALDLRAVGQTLLQPRLAMTAAMAFFSVALTLNLTGVHLSGFRMSDLRPSSVKRSIYEANAHVVRYYTNLRVVYELESRVHDLQRSSDADLPSASTGSTLSGGKDGQKGAEPERNVQEPEKQGRPRVSPGTSRREPLRDDRRVLADAGSGDKALHTAGNGETGYLSRADLATDSSGAAAGAPERGMA